MAFALRIQSRLTIQNNDLHSESFFLMEACVDINDKPTDFELCSPTVEHEEQG